MACPSISKKPQSDPQIPAAAQEQNGFKTALSPRVVPCEGAAKYSSCMDRYLRLFEGTPQKPRIQASGHKVEPSDTGIQRVLAAESAVTRSSDSMKDFCKSRVGMGSTTMGYWTLQFYVETQMRVVTPHGLSRILDRCWSLAPTAILKDAWSA